MRKTYTYRHTYAAPAGTDVRFGVRFISDGNFGTTFVNLPGDDDQFIENQGQCELGKVERLTAERTVIASSLLNPLPVSQEDAIRIAYKINDMEILHENQKAEADEVMIILIVNFTVL